MKTTTLSALAIILALARLSAGPPDIYRERGLSLDPPAAEAKLLPLIDYRLRGVPVNSAKFLEIYKLAESELQSVDHGWDARIVQSLGAGKFLIRSAYGGDLCMVQLAATGIVADNTKLTLFIKKTAGIYEYTDTLGAKRTVSIYAEYPAPAPPSPAGLVARLQSGEAILIAKRTVIVCPSCNGFGKVSDRSARRAPDGKTACETCEGSGKSQSLQPIRLIW